MGLGFMELLMGKWKKITWLEVAPTNKDSKVIAGYYLKAVQNFGK